MSKLFSKNLQREGVCLIGKKAEVSAVTKAIFVILVMIILIMTTSSHLRAQVVNLFTTTDDQVSDWDNDCLENVMDPCPCDPYITSGCISDSDCRKKMKAQPEGNGRPACIKNEDLMELEDPGNSAPQNGGNSPSFSSSDALKKFDSMPVSPVKIESCYGSLAQNEILISSIIGTPVYAVKEGLVYQTCPPLTGDVFDEGKCLGYGRNIVIQHPDGSFSRYSHLSEISVARGDKVILGQILGKTGSTSMSKEALGFMYYPTSLSDDKTDPLCFFGFKYDGSCTFDITKCPSPDTKESSGGSS